MPTKLKAWPGQLEREKYLKKEEAFFKPYFDQGVWEFADQEIDDLRNRLGLRQSRTKAVRSSWFCMAAKQTAQRLGFGCKCKNTPDGVVIQAMVQVPGRDIDG